MILLMLAAQLVYAAPPIPEGYTLIGGPGEARAVTEARFGPFVGAPEERAAAFFAAHGALLGVQGPMEVTRAPTWRGRTFVHVRQTFGGVPVAGGSATVKVDGDYVTWASGAFVDVPATLSVTPTLTAAQAAARATEGGGLAGAPVLWIERVGSRSVLAWRVPVARSQVDHVERSIDATTGAVVRVRSLGRSADGRAYLANMGTDLEDVPLDGLAAGETVLVADSARVRTRTFDGAVASSEHVAVADGAGDFLYDPTSEVEDAFAEVNAFYHVDAVASWYGERFGKTFPGRAEVVVSYRDGDEEAYDNAYFAYAFDGTYTLTMGEGTFYDFAHDPDVLVHEFSHGVLEDLANLMSEMSYPVNVDAFGLHVAPGALTEGIPDYFAVTRFDDPNMGNAIGGVGPLRDLENDKHAPDDIYGEAHADGEVLGGALWEVRARIGADASDTIVWSMLNTISTSPTFEEVSAAMLSAADDLVTDGDLTAEDRDAVEQILHDRGLATTGRAVDLGTGGEATTLWLGADILDSSFCSFMREFGVLLTPSFQYVVMAPEGATVERLDIDVLLIGDTSDVDYDLVVRKGELIEFETTIFDLGSPFEIPTGIGTVDAQQHSTEGSVAMSLDASSLDLEGGVPYYISLLGLNCNTTSAVVTASLTYEGGDTTEPEDSEPTETEPVADTGPAPTETGEVDAKGCGCASPSLAGGPALLAALALAARRRAGRA